MTDAQNRLPTAQGLMLLCGANSSASNCISASVQSIVSAMPGNLNKSILRNFWTNSTTSRDSASLARGALRFRISSSRSAFG